MTDRELLELAARAIDFKSDGQAFDGTLMTGNARWKPLTCDGDALRLAVKLHMFDAGLFMALRLEETRKDPSKNDYEITRRAIVRAAAEIGKGMK